MALIFRFIFTLLLVIGVYCQRSDVIELNAKNFEKETQANSGATTGDWMIKFYAPWCGHCKKLAPTWEEVATRLVGEINVAKVDASQDRSLATRFDIKGFPTVLFLRQGKVYKFRGPRTADKLVEFAQGGYQNSEIESEDVPPQRNIVFGNIYNMYKQFIKAFTRDLQRKKYFSPVMLTVYFLGIFALFMLALAMMPDNVEYGVEFRKKNDITEDDDELGEDDDDDDDDKEEDDPLLHDRK